MKWNIKLLAVSLLPLLFVSFGAHANAVSVQIPSEKITLNYQEPIRLAQVLSDSIRHSQNASIEFFPLINQLFNLDKEHIALELKADVMTQLNKLSNETPNFQSSVDILIEQIKRWDVGYRENVDLDIDAVRISIEKNPKLTANYELLIPKQPETISLEGLFFQPSPKKFNTSYSPAAYINDSLVLSSAHPSFVWVIYPDGHYKKVGYSYWNDENTSLTPGTTLFLGFNSDSSEINTLEEQIIKLITMRKGL